MKNVTYEIRIRYKTGSGSAWYYDCDTLDKAKEIMEKSSGQRDPAEKFKLIKITREEIEV